MDKVIEKIFQEFKNECKKKKNVIVMKQAKKDANDFFNLSNAQHVLNFITNDGLENLYFLNKKRWENNPKPKNKIMIYAFEFTTGMKLGYIAFFMNLAGKWLIKSFHLSQRSSKALEEALVKALKK
ncbi:MAG: hypothetical protein KAS65_10190 [Candidatus Aminicenantes bacterium]|nr:hypothetical protein [Candidatus Aminicenantes bacterium]